jgi:hypothetical protein
MSEPYIIMGVSAIIMLIVIVSLFASLLIRFISRHY